MSESITNESAEMFRGIVRDLGNWSGTPPVYNHCTAKRRGNLTQLKQAGLLSTFESDGEAWIQLTPAGRQWAVQDGLGDFLTPEAK